MREILFRGKRIDNGEWIYGDLYRIMGFGTGPHCLIGTPDSEDYKDPEVDPATVGQYTGLKDKNGVEIFEGDIVDFDNTDIGGKKVRGEVIFCEDPCMPYRGWALWMLSPSQGYNPCDFLGDIEIIGNIPDKEQP